MSISVPIDGKNIGPLKSLTLEPSNVGSPGLLRSELLVVQCENMQISKAAR